MNWQDLEKILNDDSTEKSIFLGNGFNISLGVDTSYQSIFESLLKNNSISQLMGEDFKKTVENNNYNLESSIDEILEIKNRNVILDKFYGVILTKCQKRIHKFNELIVFLLSFKNYFTINYDPLLYRYILMRRGSDNVPNDDFYKNLNEVHSGAISFAGGTFEDIPLRAITKKQVYDISTNIFRENNLHQEKKRDDYYNVLKKIRQERELNPDDGFTINPPRNSSKDYRIWNNQNTSQNIFYLHGSLHIYREESQARKIVLKKGSQKQTFINKIIQQYERNFLTCVFESKSKDKLKKINDSIYLKNCLDKLNSLKGLLFVIGWSASAGDKHIVDAINQSAVEDVYFSYYRFSAEEQKRVQDLFKEKTVHFFDIQELPFVKKHKKREAS